MYSTNKRVYYSGLVLLALGLSFYYHTELSTLVTEHPFHALSLAQCYLFYTIVWIYPATVKDFFALLQAPFGSKLTNPYFMSYIAHLMKCMQFYSAYILTDNMTGKGEASWPLKFCGITLFLVGQALNAGVYNSLGVKGVYYGKRFGYPIEWVTTFPFNMNLYDPQYIGAVLSVWGWFFFFQLDEVPAVYLTICYIYMSLVEYREYTPAAETEASDSKDDVRSTKKVSRKRAQTVELSVDPKANDTKTTKAKTTKTTKTKTTTGKTTPTRRKLMKNTAAY